MQLEKQVKKDKKLKGIYQQLVEEHSTVFNSEDMRGVIPAYERLYKAYELLEDYPFEQIQVANKLWLKKDCTADDLFFEADEYLTEYWD